MKTVVGEKMYVVVTNKNSHCDLSKEILLMVVFILKVFSYVMFSTFNFGEKENIFR